MLIHRIFAGALTALMLSVFSLSAACDLSCAFPQGHSDCHSMRMESQQSGSDDTAMPGMVMTGMMDAGSGNQEITVAAQKTAATHAVIGEMGPCERQSCEQPQALSAKRNHSPTGQLETICAVAGFSAIDRLPPTFHEARDGIASLGLGSHSPLNISLRI
jgi:hypothetical protein